MSSRRRTVRGASLTLAVTLACGGALLPAFAAPALAQANGTCTGLIAEEGWAPTVLDLETAHTLSTGAGVTVAVVDSGVDTDNPHLNGAVLSGEDIYGLDSTNTTGTSDVQPHGTPVATIIAGREVEGSSLIGVAPDAMIYPVRVYYSEETREGEPGFLTGAGIAEGIRRATASDAQIIVVALSQYTDDPAIAAAVAEADAAGKLVVASAGNLDDAEDVPTQPRFPAAYPQVLAVTGIGPDGLPAGAHVGDHIDIAAPGVQVLAGLPVGADCWAGTPNNATSWATAQMGGVAALIASAYPEETPAQWAYRLTATAARTDPDSRDSVLGWGVVQPVAALKFVDDGSARGPASGDWERPPVVVPEVEPVVVEAHPDPWVSPRRTVAWWALGSGSVVLAALLVSRLPRRSRSRGRTAT